MDYKAMNLEFLRRIRHGDESARDEMIVSNRELVYGLVHLYRSTCPFRHPPQIEELVAIGLVGLVRACQSIHPWHPEPGGYLAQAIKREIRRNARTEHWDGQGPRRRIKAKDGTGYVPRIRRLQTVASDRKDKGEVVGRKSPRNGGLSEVELRDSIRAACDDEVDGRIIELLEKGHTGPEIAEIVGRHPSIVYHRLTGLRNRIKLLQQGLSLAEVKEREKNRENPR